MKCPLCFRELEVQKTLFAGRPVYKCPVFEPLILKTHYVLFEEGIDFSHRGVLSLMRDKHGGLARMKLSEGFAEHREILQEYEYYILDEDISKELDKWIKRLLLM